MDMEELTHGICRLREGNGSKARCSGSLFVCRTCKKRVYILYYDIICVDQHHVSSRPKAIQYHAISERALATEASSPKATEVPATGNLGVPDHLISRLA